MVSYLRPDDQSNYTTTTKCTQQHMTYRGVYRDSNGINNQADIFLISKSKDSTADKLYINVSLIEILTALYSMVHLSN